MGCVEHDNRDWIIYELMNLFTNEKSVSGYSNIKNSDGLITLSYDFSGQVNRIC